LPERYSRTREEYQHTMTSRVQ